MADTLGGWPARSPKHAGVLCPLAACVPPGQQAWLASLGCQRLIAAEVDPKQNIFPAPAGIVDTAKLAEVDAICQQFVAQPMPGELAGPGGPAAQARRRGLRSFVSWAPGDEQLRKLGGGA